MKSIVIVGCGDIGLRVALILRPDHVDVTGVVRSSRSADTIQRYGILPHIADLDVTDPVLPNTRGNDLYYFLPPPRSGTEDNRSITTINRIREACPRRVVLISTTGVYGDCGGKWVDEKRMLAPGTPRAARRADAEVRWREWANNEGVPLTILRVPGIYSKSRIPVRRLESGDPVVDPAECGWTNRIHADDLANICVEAMKRANGLSIFNVSDGQPGTITEYLLAAVKEIDLPGPPVIPLSSAVGRLTPEMLSYLSESRRIDNSKMLRELSIILKYPRLSEGLKH
jgi:nucleoside-diphosphate-sugar epimerase